MIEQKYYHPEIKWYHRINPLWWIGNIDDPYPPAKFASKIVGWSEWKIWVWWRIRNPFHNFTRYVIGLCGRDITINSKYQNELFAPRGLNWFLVKYKWIILPGISYKGMRWRGYTGWLDSGQFGLELRF